MAEKKKANAKTGAAKKETAAKKKTASKKTDVKKTTAKKESVKKVDAKNERKVVDAYEIKRQKEKKQNKLVKWFNNLTLEQVIIGGVTIIAILLIVLIGVSTKNTKTKDGNDIVVQVDGKTITANDLYEELKKQSGQSVEINLIDDYILNKEYETTSEMEESAESTIETYKNTYGDSYEQFLEYNGISDDNELKELLIKNSKLTSATEDYIKDNLTEKEMKEYYENNIVGDISAKHILISYEEDEDLSDEENEAKKEEAKAKAEEVIEKRKNGEDFSALAKEYSDDEGTKENGGDLGYFNTGDMVEAFETAAYALDVNEYTTEPVETEYGYHIIYKVSQKEKPALEDVKEKILDNLVDELLSEKNDNLFYWAGLREKYNMNILDEVIKDTYDSTMKLYK